MHRTLEELVALSRDLGREDRELAILGEGNTSARLADDQFTVKSSGACLASLSAEELTACRVAPMLALLDQKQLSDAQTHDALMAARVDPAARKPSIESVFHAWLLTLEGVGFVGHTHPLAVNQILCSPRARDFSERRMFPDEIVICGAASVFVPYTDPGLPLAREIRDRTRAYLDKQGHVPRLILLQNHGLIALGSNPASVLAATLMAVKAAAIFQGAAAMGGPTFLTPQHVERIAGRADEAYRQQQLKLGAS
ncbi:MAG: class II aldolase/adducin family protein [Verrucomicrobiales bacterium]|nr:class II aldolase/adducin family protein [Verrucomicrobiales bacterium]